MNYNNFFRWSGLKTYTCNICGEVVDMEQRRRHMGEHFRDGEYVRR